MKVKANQIGPQGLDLDDTIAAEYIGFTDKDYLRFIRPLNVHAHIDRVSKTLIGRFQVSGRFSSSCYRTSVPVERDWRIDFTLNFSVEDENKFVEMDEDIRQEVILNVPLRVLSDEEMAKEPEGGTGRQTEEEDIPAERTYRPFEKLKDIE